MVLKLLALIVPLGLDTFVVAAALGVAGIPRPRRQRVSLLLAAFEGLMPLVGLALGVPLGHALGSDAEFVAVAVLIAFGLYVLFADEDEDETVQRLAAGAGWGVIPLGLSVSLDELAIGFALGVLRLPVLLVIPLIAAQALLLSQLGMRLGGRLNSELREGAERVAGGILVALGIGLVLVRLLGG